MARVQRPRILCVADAFPWPARDGYRIRLSHVVEALTGIGEVTLFAAENRTPRLDAIPPNVMLHELKVSQVPSRGRMVARSLVSPIPRRILARDWTPARAELHSLSREPYDLAWYSHVDSLVGLGGVPARATVLDADNLEDMRLRSLGRAHLRGLAAALDPRRATPALQTELLYRAKGLFQTHEAPRWERLQRRLSGQVDAMVVCSELDRQRLGASNAVVIPNGYDDPGRRPELRSGNVMAMVGALHYPPNAEGARFFVRDVLPRVRARIPDATVRLIGRHDGQLSDLDGMEGVEIRGEVEDIVEEITRARVSVVPLRAGSGTRLKVLEGFACRVPVVSTPIGCEGLGAVAGRHLLVAEDPSGFAESCARLLSDDGLHDSITREARSLFESHYQWSDIHRRIGELARSLVGPSVSVSGVGAGA